MAIDSLPQEIFDLIIGHVARLAERRHGVMLMSELYELLALRKLCRGFSEATLSYIYKSLTLCRHFISFTRSMTARPDRAKYIVELNIFYDLPQSYESYVHQMDLQSSKETIYSLIPSSFTSLRRLAMAAPYLKSHLGALSAETAPFKTLETFSTVGSRSLEPSISIDLLQPIWQSPQLQICRLQCLTLLPGNLKASRHLPPVAEMDLAHSKFPCALLSNLTTIREISKLELQGSQVLEPFQPVQGVRELTRFPSGAVGVPRIDPYIRVEHLNFSSASPVKLVNTQELELPQASTLNIQIACCRTDRSVFLMEVKRMIVEKVPSTLQRIHLEGLDGAWEWKYKDLRTWNTGGNKFSELSEPGDPDRETDYRNFDGYNALKELCSKQGITLSWEVRD